MVNSYKLFAFLCLVLFIQKFTTTQKATEQSLKNSLTQKLNDTTRVEVLRKLSMNMQALKPDSALYYAEEGLELAQKIHYKKGEAACLNRLGAVLWRNGKYDRSLSFLLSSLKIREEIDDIAGELRSLNDIGIVYSDQNDNRKALWYHFKAKAIAETLNDKKSLIIVFSNIGNCFAKLNKTDSALFYELQAYRMEQILQDSSTLPNTLSILGDIYLKTGKDSLALKYYKLSIPYYTKNNDLSGLADTYNSLGNYFYKSGIADSSVFYTTKALESAKAGSYTQGIYNASDLLSKVYGGKSEHLELLYFKAAMAAKDSLFNAERIKHVQELSFSEAARQQELAQLERRENEARIINLQLIGIAIFIPFFFLFLLLLSKSRTHAKIIEFMTVISLLLVFEFITLLIHPLVARISNHLPALELLILVILAAVLVPLHHKTADWLHERLAHISHHHKETHKEHAKATPHN